MWFDQGTYLGSLPPGAFTDSDYPLTQQKIRQRLDEVGFMDPMWNTSRGTRTMTTSSSTGCVTASASTFPGWETFGNPWDYKPKKSKR